MRANPAYELVVFDRLMPAEQKTLEALGRDPDNYGILRPRTGGGLSMKSVSRDTALLLLTLENPGPLPRYVTQSLGTDCDRVIGKMLLDGILEVEVAGEMLSGAAAQAAIFGERAEPEATKSELAALSDRALAYAERIAVADPMALSARLYMYNRAPATLRWRRLLFNQDAVESHLGIRNGAIARLLERGWARLPEAGTHAWIAWRSPRGRSDGTSTLTYKLYVSPACDDVRSAFEATAQALVRSNAVQWKVGADVYGILRPDKIVVYFTEFADLQETAAQIQSRLTECGAHGVPFTAQLAGDGLLSWGVDPPSEEHAVDWLKHESWRLRITNHLASALLQAKGSGHAGAAACRFAVHRVGLEGIDTATWAPTGALAWSKRG
jgi:hypothetical protein